MKTHHSVVGFFMYAVCMFGNEHTVIVSTNKI